jgi:hypothetical protein
VLTVAQMSPLGGHSRVRTAALVTQRLRAEQMQRRNHNHARSHALPGVQTLAVQMLSFTSTEHHACAPPSRLHYRSAVRQPFSSITTSFIAVKALLSSESTCHSCDHPALGAVLALLTFLYRAATDPQALGVPRSFDADGTGAALCKQAYV